MGYPYWGSDTGGYWGKKANFTHENLSRWLAFSCFTPIMEVGPLRDRAVWDMPTSPSYDTTLIATYRLYAKMHTHLKNYAYKMAKNAHQTGEPIIHPMAMAYPNDKKAAKRWDEYLYGHDILVGIIWKNGQRKFKMYLPKGSWTSLWTGKEYSGSQTVTIDCPLPKIPIFTRKNSDINLGNPQKIYKQSLKIAKNKPNLKQLLREEDFGMKSE
jgi:alpha-glucosidase (family GH31 glycosyl hydrolase)